GRAMLQGRVAAAGAADEKGASGGGDLHVDVADRGHLPEHLPHGLEADVSHQRDTLPHMLNRYFRITRITTSDGAIRKKPPANRKCSGDWFSTASISAGSVGLRSVRM